MKIIITSLFIFYSLSTYAQAKPIFKDTVINAEQSIYQWRPIHTSFMQLTYKMISGNPGFTIDYEGLNLREQWEKIESITVSTKTFSKFFELENKIVGYRKVRLRFSHPTIGLSMVSIYRLER